MGIGWYRGCCARRCTYSYNVAIGANAVVNKDIVEENVAVADVLTKIISRNGTLNWNRKQFDK